MGDEVTAILDRFRGFLGTGSPVAAPTPSSAPTVSQDRLSVPGQGTGTIATAATINRTAQAQVAGIFSKVDPSLVPVVDKSITDNTTARRTIDQIGSTYDGRATSLKPVSNTVTGQVALTQAKIEAVGDGAANTRGSVSNAQLRAALVEALARRIAAQSQSQAQAGQSGGSGSGSGGGAGSGAGSPASGVGSALTSATKPLDSGQAAKIATILALASKSKGKGTGTSDSSSDTGATTISAGDTAGASERARKAIAFAMAQRGKPYGWGATGPNSWDCSSLLQAAAREAGVSVPRVTYDQIRAGQAVTGALKPGDFIFGNFQNGRPEHVQMYIGGGKVIHAPQTGDVVRIADYNPSGTRARRMF